MPFAKQRGAAPIYRTPEHRRARATLIKAFRPGDPCCLCGHPMYPPTSGLHADHDPVNGGYRGLSHMRCNVRDGAKRGRARQNTRATQLRW
jgi:hypothetical protein